MRGKILVLCYHGVAQDDEHRWRPALFVSPYTLARRLDYLRREGLPVVSLAQGLERLGNDSLPWAIAITFDDGFYNYAALAEPCLRRYGVPATLYVASYYSLHPEWPVFDLIIDYMFWRCSDRSVAGAVVGSSAPLSGASRDDRERSVERVYAYAEQARLRGAEKDALARKIASELQFDYDAAARARLLCLMSEAEMRNVATNGTDLQLHTHRHQLPATAEGMERELTENREVLARVSQTPVVDFCYPSGLWDEAMWPVLERAGIRSATTCEPGFVDADTPRYALPRFLDSEAVSQIEFEAWVSGFWPLLRAALAPRPEKIRSPRSESYSSGRAVGGGR
jgi:peptidoglycan/xylan/chitin deacetylase (PgdA/CDA1 family)